MNMCGSLSDGNGTRKLIVDRVQAARITPKGFKSEEAMLDSIVQSCRGKRTLMLTGNYAVKEGPNIEQGDRRLLGEDMLLTIELCARAYKRCVDAGVEPPAILLVPNDIIPETFQNFEEERAFKSAYTVPYEIRALLAAAGIAHEPVYFFNRDFNMPGEVIARRVAHIRDKITRGTEKLIVVFESFAQNLAAKALSRGKMKHAEEIESDHTGRKRAIVPASIVDTYSKAPQNPATAVTITNPNGSPYCSFLAATLFKEFEHLGFQQMVNTFVSEEHPCVDKAAAAYMHFHEGRMPIRNIYLDGSRIVVDSTIIG
jgi:hypothetical protein